MARSYVKGNLGGGRQPEGKRTRQGQKTRGLRAPEGSICMGPFLREGPAASSCAIAEGKQPRRYAAAVSGGPCATLLSVAGRVPRWVGILAPPSVIGLRQP